MNVSELRAGVRVQWRTWYGEMVTASVLSWSDQGMRLRDDDGYDRYWPTDSAGLAGLAHDLTVVS